MKDSKKLGKPVKSILRRPHFNYDGTVEGYSQFTPEVFEQEGFNHEQEHKKWEEITLRQLNYHANSKAKEKYKIPPITHSIYLTSNQSPTKMKDLYIDNYGKTSERLSAKDSNFVHYLWVNFDPKDPKYKNVIPEEIRAIPNLRISNIREFEGHPLYQNTIDFLENGRDASKFVEASDLVRVMAVEAKGGLYHDLDWKLYDAKEMIKYMKNFDFIGGREGEEWTSSIGNAMFAAKAEHPVVRKLSQLIERNLNEKNPELLPDYIKYPQREFDRVIFNSGPIAITMAYNLAGSKEENRDLICPSKVLYNADYARSHPTGNLHIPYDLTHSWKGIPIKTIGGDQFSGNWGKTYLNPIRYNRNDLEIAKELSPTDQEYLEEALAAAVREDNQAMFKELLPKIIDQDHLEDALVTAVIEGNQAMFKELLPKMTDPSSLGVPLIIAVQEGNQAMFKELLPKMTRQYFLGCALREAVESNRHEMFKELLPKITDQEYLEEALELVESQDNKDMLSAIKNHKYELNYKYYIGDNLESLGGLLSSSKARLSNWFESNDILKIFRGAELGSGIDAPTAIAANSLISSASKSGTTSIPSINMGDSSSDKKETKTSNLNVNMGDSALDKKETKISDERFVDTINQRIFMGTAALAMLMKSLGQNTDWAKPLLGGGTVKVESSFDVKDLVSHISPEYDYTAILKETTKMVPPLEKDALKRIHELAQSKTAEGLSKDEWQDLIKEDKKLKALLETVIEKDKIRKTNSIPVIKDSLRDSDELPKPRKKLRRR